MIFCPLWRFSKTFFSLFCYVRSFPTCVTFVHRAQLWFQIVIRCLFCCIYGPTHGFCGTLMNNLQTFRNPFAQFLITWSLAGISTKFSFNEIKRFFNVISGCQVGFLTNWPQAVLIMFIIKLQRSTVGRFSHCE